MNKVPILLHLHPFNDVGAPIDASFGVESLESGFALLYASRGGTKGTTNSRNSEYHIGLTVLLNRLKQLDALITTIALDSIAARQLPMLDRTLKLPDDMQFPVRLAAIEDIDKLRRKVSDAQKNVLAAAGRSSKHGNRMRSIRIQFNLPDPHDKMSAEGIAQILVGDDASVPTADPTVLDQRITRLKSLGLLQKPEGRNSPVDRELASVIRYVRSPAVAAYVLQRAGGLCELCARVSFRTDSGVVFLEVHHIVQLSAGGADTPSNTAALCPNCHRELHYGADRVQLVASLYERISELRRFRG